MGSPLLIVAEGIWALPVRGEGMGGLNACPNGQLRQLWHLRLRQKVPQSARLSAGEGGLQKLFWQCPNAFCDNGASLILCLFMCVSNVFNNIDVLLLLLQLNCICIMQFAPSIQLPEEMTLCVYHGTMLMLSLHVCVVCVYYQKCEIATVIIELLLFHAVGFFKTIGQGK